MPHVEASEAVPFLENFVDLGSMYDDELEKAVAILEHQQGKFVAQYDTTKEPFKMLNDRIEILKKAIKTCHSLAKTLKDSANAKIAKTTTQIKPDAVANAFYLQSGSLEKLFVSVIEQILQNVHRAGLEMQKMNFRKNPDSSDMKRFFHVNQAAAYVRLANVGSADTKNIYEELHSFLKTWFQ